MDTIDEAIIARLEHLKANRWPKSLRLEESSLDLSKERIEENEVTTLDEFEQCWRDTYYTVDSYDFLNHLLASAVAFQARRIGRELNLLNVHIDDVDLAEVLSHVHRSVRHAIEQEDISSYDELLQGG